MSADVHDIVSHALTLIAVRSGVARVVLEQRPEEARQALRAIETTSRTALDQLRTALHRSRRPGNGPDRAGTGPTAGATHPVEAPGQSDQWDQWAAGRSIADDRHHRSTFLPAGGLGGPTLDDVRPLIDELRADGRDIALRHDRGVGPPPPPLVEETAFRIVQQSLSNVIRHAGTASTTVTIERRQGQLVVEVVNGPPATPGDPSAELPSPRWSPSGGSPAGYGLVGMRERVALHDGTVEAGPRPDGGFAVRAVLPIPGQRPAPSTERRPAPADTEPSGGER